MSTTNAIGLSKPDMNDTVQDLVNIVGSYADMFNAIFPVGAVWMCVRNTNPNNIFPGTTWRKIESRFLIGASGSYPSDTVGGQASVQLTTAQMPSHTHNAQYSSNGQRVGLWYSDASDGNKWRVASTYAGGDPDSNREYLAITNTGGNQAHNNIPPYKAVYIWERTA